MSEMETQIEDRARAVFSSRADMYVTSAVHSDPRSLGRLVELAQVQPDWLVLDVATGTGHTALAFAPHVDRVVAFDLTSQMLTEARKLAGSGNVSRVQFVLADIHELPFDDERFDDGTYDLVTCRRAAHHFRDINFALEEMVRMLKPGGLLLIDDRAVPEDDFVDGIMNRLDWLHDESHVHQYRPSEWQAMLKQAACLVEFQETTVLHRPLRSLTDRVSPQNVAEIQRVFDGLAPEQREKLAVQEIDGELYSNHWYITLLARKNSS